MDVKRPFLFCFALVLLFAAESGCVTEPTPLENIRWVQDGKSPDDVRHDLAECESEASKIEQPFPSTYDSTHPNSYAVQNSDAEELEHRRYDYVISAMRARGYQAEGLEQAKP